MHDTRIPTALAKPCARRGYHHDASGAAPRHGFGVVRRAGSRRSRPPPRARVGRTYADAHADLVDGPDAGRTACRSGRASRRIRSVGRDRSGCGDPLGGRRCGSIGVVRTGSAGRGGGAPRPDACRRTLLRGVVRTPGEARLGMAFRPRPRAGASGPARRGHWRRPDGCPRALWRQRGHPVARTPCVGRPRDRAEGGSLRPHDIGPAPGRARRGKGGKGRPRRRTRRRTRRVRPPVDGRCREECRPIRRQGRQLPLARQRRTPPRRQHTPRVSPH